MAEKIKLSEEERLRRKEFDLPVTRSLRYMKLEGGMWHEYPVLEYEVVETLATGSRILMLTVDGHKPVKILDVYFADMQKLSFVDDMNTAE